MVRDPLPGFVGMSRSVKYKYSAAMHACLFFVFLIVAGLVTQ